VARRCDDPGDKSRHTTERDPDSLSGSAAAGWKQNIPDAGEVVPEPLPGRMPKKTRELPVLDVADEFSGAHRAWRATSSGRSLSNGELLEANGVSALVRG
jgi:hypothetical protein